MENTQLPDNKHYDWEWYTTMIINQTVDNMLESMVDFAEKLPHNQNDKADAIRSMLLENIVLGRIPDHAVTPAMKERICNLAKKEAPRQIENSAEPDIIEEAELLHDEASMHHTHAIHRKGGRKAEPLFGDKAGNKDTLLTRQKADAFLSYLSEQNITHMHVNTQQENDINKAFLHHYSTWVAEGLVPRMPNTRACYRFLANDCSLTFDVSEKSFSEFIRRQIF
ncbi:MAG: hypothetical protein IIW93_01085 [Bacteroidaceae bacterium]|nr:hypothetical protein [Bacteroidaceae bacterium]